MLNLSGSVGGTGTPNTPATTSARDFSVYRPHIASLRTTALSGYGEIVPLLGIAWKLHDPARPEPGLRAIFAQADRH